MAITSLAFIVDPLFGVAPCGAALRNIRNINIPTIHRLDRCRGVPRRVLARYIYRMGIPLFDPLFGVAPLLVALYIYRVMFSKAK